MLLKKNVSLKKKVHLVILLKLSTLSVEREKVLIIIPVWYGSKMFSQVPQISLFPQIQLSFQTITIVSELHIKMYVPNILLLTSPYL